MHASNYKFNTRVELPRQAIAISLRINSFKRICINSKVELLNYDDVLKLGGNDM